MTATATASTLETNVILVESRWPLLLKVLERAMAEEEGPLREESLFVWDCVDRVICGHGLGSNFGAWLCAQTVSACTNFPRIFREDSVATRWLTRRFLAQSKVPLVEALRAPLTAVLEATTTVALGDLPDVRAASALLRAVFHAVFQERLCLGLMVPLSRVRDELISRGVNMWPPLGRLIMLRWVGTIPVEYALWERKSRPLTATQRVSLLTISKLMIVLGEGSVGSLEESSPLQRFADALQGPVIQEFGVFLRAQVSAEDIEAHMDAEASAEAKAFLQRTRKQKAFQLYIETLKGKLLEVGCDPELLG